MNRHTVTVFFLWFVLTALGEFVILGTNLFRYPVVAAEEATMVDAAFRFLTVLAVPVPAFVLSVMAYSVLRFRSSGPDQDGPPVHIHRPWVAFWFTWTTGLTLFVIVFPGITGLLDIRHNAAKPVDLVVKAEGSRWFWKVTYPEQGVTTMDELVLPAGKHVRFDVTATDVLHSFWIPAFRMKIDAVPGMVTTVHATTTKTGSFTEDPQFRLQCAELCGLAHNIMRVPVRVVSDEEFAVWVAAQRARQARSPQT
ncbi:MAG: cytochrome c oxidase subunit II [Chloroflexi bacterium]|nr:cytochrome c oxidase subunit II [Chloroflexota bacterium]